MSDSVRLHRWQPTRPRHPWDFPGKSTGVGCHCLLREPSSLRSNSLTGLSHPSSTWQWDIFPQCTPDLVSLCWKLFQVPSACRLKPCSVDLCPAVPTFPGWSCAPQSSVPSFLSTPQTPASVFAWAVIFVWKNMSFWSLHPPLLASTAGRLPPSISSQFKHRFFEAVLPAFSNLVSFHVYSPTPSSLPSVRIILLLRFLPPLSLVPGCSVTSFVSDSDTMDCSLPGSSVHGDSPGKNP